MNRTDRMWPSVPIPVTDPNGEIVGYYPPSNETHGPKPGIYKRIRSALIEAIKRFRVG